MHNREIPRSGRNWSSTGEGALELQSLILGELGLEVPVATTQVVGRDRYIEWVGWMANVATSIEKILQEVRNLQRTEIGEVAEEFDERSRSVHPLWLTRRIPLLQRMHVVSPE